MDGKQISIADAIEMLRVGLKGATEAAGTTHHVSIVLTTMVAALVATHPDKGALHAAFQKIWTDTNGPSFSVSGLQRGDTTIANVLNLLALAIGRELP